MKGISRFAFKFQWNNSPYLPHNLPGKFLTVRIVRIFLAQAWGSEATSVASHASSNVSNVGFVGKYGARDDTRVPSASFSANSMVGRTHTRSMFAVNAYLHGAVAHFYTITNNFCYRRVYQKTLVFCVNSVQMPARPM